MRRLQTFPSKGGSNSLDRWWQVRHPLRVYFNWFVIRLSKFCPSLRLKNGLLRLTGMKIGKGARIAAEVSFDFFFPELIEIGEGAIIGYQALIVAHEFLVDEYRIGPVVIGKGALVGARAVVLAGVRIGEGAEVGAMSLVHSDIPAFTLAGGVPARMIKKLKNEQKNVRSNRK